MKAMILAAGLGTRLRPLTNSIPKPLLPIGGRPIIVWNLLLLRAGGIRDVIINLHYLGHLIQEAVGDGSYWGMRITYSHESTLLGTGGGLKAAEKLFEKQPVVVFNGDTLIKLDVKTLIQFHQSHSGVATLVLRDDPQAAQWGVVETDMQNCILRINGRGRSPVDSPGPVLERMFAGVHILDPSILNSAPSGIPFSIIDSYTNALAGGRKIYGFFHADYWSDIGTVERYVQAQADAERELNPFCSQISS